jgi:hypothetical protein
MIAGIAYLLFADLKIRGVIMSLQKLKEEIQKPKYQGLDDSALAEAINNLKVYITIPIKTKDVEAYAVRKGFWSDIDDGKNDANIQKRKLCKNVMAWVDRMDSIDSNSLEFHQMIQGLLYFKIIEQEHVQEIVAMSQLETRWVDHIGVGTVGLGYLNLARGIK